MDVAEAPLEAYSAVPGGRGRCILTGCRGVPPGRLRTLFVEGSPAADVPVAFRDAGGKVRFPEVFIKEGGSLRAVLQNRWEGQARGCCCGGRGGSYSLLPHARRLKIENNSQAIKDLVDYVQGTYQLGEHWEQKELPRGMEITVHSTETELRLVQALRARFARVVLCDVQVEGMVLSSLGQYNTIEGAVQYVFTGCRGVPRKRLQQLIVNDGLEAEVPVAFWDADRKVCLPEIRISRRGNLKTVLQNHWEDGNGNGGYYSLLHHAKELWILSNSQVIRDLLAYAEGEYQLGEHWERKELSKGMKVTIWRVEVDLPMVERLRRHFDIVQVWTLNMALRADTTINVECTYLVFTGCRDVQPRSLAVDAGIERDRIEFRDADGEVHIPHIAIGPHGSLKAVVRNSWGDSMADRCYSLLPHAEALTVRNNPQAVRDLADHVAGEYKTGDPRWPTRPLSKDLRLTIEGVTGCEKGVGTLVEYFGVVRVDGRKVLSMERRQLLDGCNARERALRPLRAEAEGRWRALRQAADSLAGEQRGVRRARLRLQEARGRLGALMSVAQ